MVSAQATQAPSFPCVVERFQRTAKDKFFEITLRTKVYASLDELQHDLDEWLVYYNTERAH